MPLTSTNTPIPTNYLFLLYPCHQLLDSAGPLDILSMVTKQPQGANITLTFAAETLDPIPLAALPPASATWTFENIDELPRSKDGGIGGRGFNPKLTPDITFASALESLHRSDGKGIEITDEITGHKVLRSVDVLFVPGGIGSRMFRVQRDLNSGKVVKRWGNADSVVDFVREVCERQWVQSAVMTVCTGSDLLARTGLLDGRRATTNVTAFDKVAARSAGVKWQRYARWVRSLPEENPALSTDSSGGYDSAGQGSARIEREVWTSAGISAGMDLMLWFMAEIYGRDFARGVSHRLEYEWRENVGDGEADPYYTEDEYWTKR